MSKKKVFRLGELFCGPGGIAVGADLVQHDEWEIVHAWATDYHPDTCSTYKKNIFRDKGNNVICHDIRTLDLESLTRISEVDALAFGFPCNDFSLVGEQRGTEGHYGPLYSYCAQALRKFKPKWFLAENVGGLSSSNDGKAFISILNEFRSCGYNLFPHLYKFEEYGVPQARHRIIIIGIRYDLNIEFKIPAPLGVIKTAGEVLSNVPEGLTHQEITKQSEKVVERLKYIRPGQNAFNADIPNHLKLNVRGAKISQIYKRLDPDKPAYTVTGSGGGGTHMYHWDEPRALTNRERAILQTFPFEYQFCGSKESIRRQIGMAVPPEGVKHIFLAVFNCFSNILYKSVKSSFDPLYYNPDKDYKDEESILLDEVKKLKKDLQ